MRGRMGRGRRRGFAQSRMGPTCITKKKFLKLPQSVRKDRRLFTHDVDEFWGVGCGLSNLQAPLWAVLPRAVLPESCRQPGSSAVPSDATGCRESPQNPSPCGSTSAGKPGLCHSENLGATGPAPFAKATPPLGHSHAGSAGHQPSPLLQLLLFPLCFH